MLDGRRVDLRLQQGRIIAMGTLVPLPGETCLQASGGLVIPGLHDHHIHFRALARALDSIPCGPPRVSNEADLIRQLQAAAATPGSAADGPWLRGIGYHESVAGDINREWLDRVVPEQPVRIQHRSGRLWILNSMAVDQLVRRADGNGESLTVDTSGRLFDQDSLLGRLLGHTSIDPERASRQLAAFGITGITDMTPGNDVDTFENFRAWQLEGRLRQQVLMAGRPDLPAVSGSAWLTTGPTKVHLHDHDLIPFDTLTTLIRSSHAHARPVAVHCVTELALVYTLSAFRDAGVWPGDRIEHASVTPASVLSELRDLGLLVVTQPNFIAERGDQYRQDIPQQEHDSLYRCASFQQHGIPLAAGSDAPFGSADPWASMRAAVLRQTAAGHVLGEAEKLSPEAALALFLGHLEAPENTRRLTPGAPADLCILEQPWSRIRSQLQATAPSPVTVRATLRLGSVIFDRVDQTPG